MSRGLQSARSYRIQPTPIREWLSRSGVHDSRCGNQCESRTPTGGRVAWGTGWHAQAKRGHGDDLWVPLESSDCRYRTTPSPKSNLTARRSSLPQWGNGLWPRVEQSGTRGHRDLPDEHRPGRGGGTRWSRRRLPPLLRSGM